MEYLLDTANIELIKKYCDFLPISGITSNPTIIKKEGKIDFYNHFKEIRNIIGKDKTLHIQVLGEKCDDILKDADAILTGVDENVYVKIPVTMEGIKAIQILKKQNVGITATAIYTKMQGFMAMEANADFIAPYYNRMENMDINPIDAISAFSDMIDQYGYNTKILAASFKNMGQVNDAILAGAQTVTMDPSIIGDAFKMPSIQKAVDDFNADFEAVFGKNVSLSDLLK